jgi:hypothetical protein
MYPGHNSVPTKCQQSGDKAERECNTVASKATPHGDDNSICVNDLAAIALPHYDISLKGRYDKLCYKFGNLIEHSLHCTQKYNR